MPDLFSPLALGRIELRNRIVMAPMTRSRALGNVPNPLMAEYYAQRATAGLIITEGVAPLPEGLGYARIPGLFSPAQIEGWRGVTDAVHGAGGRIFAQLMHVGRIAHQLNLPAGANVLAPSAVTAEGPMYTDQQGPQPMSAPAAMTEAELAAARDGYVQAARNAITAGFDGIELHGANGYLLEQFLSPHTNRREDGYGGSVAARARFVLEVVDASAKAIGADRVGIRLSPYNTYNDMRVHPEVDAQYVAVAEGLRKVGIAYVHLVGNPHEAAPATHARVRSAFGGITIANGGFDGERARATVADGGADLISFGRPFIANPDLVERLRGRSPLAAPNPATFYTPGGEGYVDYPRASEQGA